MNKKAELVVNALIQEVEQKNISGPEKKEYVNETIIQIIDGAIPVLNFIPDTLKEEGLELLENQIIEELKTLLPKIGDFIENCFKKLFHKK